MIIKGGSRSSEGFFASHLMNGEQNERVSIVEIVGLSADNITQALEEMALVASATHCKNHFYHATINPRAEEPLSVEQWDRAVDVLEQELGLTGHSRFIVEHEKEGRVHRHIIWSRIDADSMTAVSDSNNYVKHELAAIKLTKEFGHEPVEPCLTRETQEKRPDRLPDDWEVFRGKESKIDPREIKAEVTEIFKASPDGVSFKQDLEEAGYILCQGDRRDFCIIDSAGDEHSLARRLDGLKAKELREFMAGVDRESLPSVAQGRRQAKERRALGNQDKEGLESENQEEEIESPSVDKALQDTEAIQQPEQLLTDIQQELQPFTEQVLSQGHIDMYLPDMGGNEGLNWHERFTNFISRVTEHAKDWYEDTKEKAISWIDYMRGRKDRDQGFDLER
jgi:hypothetical protein